MSCDQPLDIDRTPDTVVIAVRAKQSHPNATHLEDLLADVGAVPYPSADIVPENPATLFSTSGTTGHPNALVLAPPPLTPAPSPRPGGS